jgi:hypothetical protein
MDGKPSQATFGFLVREVEEGEGFEAGWLRGVVQRIDRSGPKARLAISLEVMGLAAPLMLDLQPEDLAISYRDEVLGIALRGKSSVKMRIKAPRDRKINRVRVNPTPIFPSLTD